MTTKTIPNTTAALDALPVGVILRGTWPEGQEEVLLRTDSGEWAAAGSGPWEHTAHTVALAERAGITEWTVLWPIAEPEWTGWIVGGEFSRGDDGRTGDCANCSCDCHDYPRAAGTYATVKLDDDAASLRRAHVAIQEMP